MEKKYLRWNDLSERYGVTKATITNMVKSNLLPKPMTIGTLKVWPIDLIDSIDKKNDNAYYKTIDPVWNPNNEKN